MGAVVVVFGSLLNALLLAVVARRLLGVPVGWPRSLLLSLMANSAAGPLLNWTLDRLGAESVASAEDRAATVLLVALFVAWLVAVEVGILAILEALVPTGSLPGPVEWVRTLPARWRRTRRYATIVRIAARHGLGGFLSPRPPGDIPTPATARALRLALTEGGVTFVKLGQMLATRPDVVGADFVAELSRLHADVPPQPWPAVLDTLTAELGRDPDEVFAEIETEPLAAASVAQVHRARLHSGERVVVKVQRSTARAQVTADLDIVRRLAAWLQRTAPWARRLGVENLAAGFAQSLEEELDFRVEAANVAAVNAASRGDRVRTPRLHRALCSRRLLVMEQMAGTPLSSAGPQLARRTAAERRALAEALLDTVLDQVLVSGVFHADLHPGNVMIDDDGGLSLLDFGSVGRLDRGARTSLGLLMLAVERQDPVAATQALTDVLESPGTLDDRALERDLGQLVMRVGGSPGQAGELFVHLLRLVLDHGLSVPPSVAAAFRALGALEGTLMLLSPEADLVAAARRRGREVLRDQLSPEGVKAELTDQLVTLLPMAQRLPRRISALVEDLHAGTFTITVRTLQDPRERRFLTALVHQIVVSLLSATTAISGILLVLARQGPEMAGSVRLTTYLGLVLLLFAFVLGSRVVVLVFRGGFEQRRVGDGP